MEVRTRWLVAVLVGLGLAIFSVDGGELPQASAVSAQAAALPAMTHNVAPNVFNSSDLNSNSFVANDYFWLGAILALILALISVYVRWAVLERSQ
jgi:hypothetical protein